MPEGPQWLSRLPEIIKQLNELATPAIDRRTIESVFQLKRRRAIELMHELGSRRNGKGYCLDRTRLLQDLRRLQDGPAFRWSQRGSQESSGSEQQHFGGPRTDTATPDELAPDHDRLPYLPIEVRLRPGKMEIEFRSAEDLIQILTELHRTMQQDQDRARLLLRPFERD